MELPVVELCKAVLNLDFVYLRQKLVNQQREFFSPEEAYSRLINLIYVSDSIHW